MRNTTELKDKSSVADSSGQISPIGLFKIPLRQENRVIINIWSSEANINIPGANVGHVSLETPDRYISLWPEPRQPHRVNTGLGKLLGHTGRKIESYFKARPPLWKANYLEDCLSEAVCEDKYRTITSIDECHSYEHVVVEKQDGSLMLLPDLTTIPEKATLYAVTPYHASVRIALYGLKVDAIHRKFGELQQTIPGWRLVGSNLLTRMLDSASHENCSSLAYCMLDTGGMYNYENTKKLRDFSKISSERSEVSIAVRPDALIKHVIHAKKKELDNHKETSAWLFEGASDLTMLEKAYNIDRDAKEVTKKFG